jgi:hypothetical protein
MNRTLAIAALVILVGSLGLMAEEETAPTVSELEDFIDVMHEAMHGPVEEGDTETLAQMIDPFLKANEALQKATLPEAYADVSEDFDRALGVMQLAVDRFDSAVAATDSAAMMNSILEIHTAVSRLEAALTGTCYELVLLHDVIAPIQHRALPDEDWEAICAALPVLGKRIADLKEAELPSRHEALKNKLLKHMEKMETAFLDLESACDPVDPEVIPASFDEVHTQFHHCMELFH